MQKLSLIFQEISDSLSLTEKTDRKAQSKKFAYLRFVANALVEAI